MGFLQPWAGCAGFPEAFLGRSAAIRAGRFRVAIRVTMGDDEGERARKHEHHDSGHEWQGMDHGYVSQVCGRRAWIFSSRLRFSFLNFVAFGSSSSSMSRAYSSEICSW